MQKFSNSIDIPAPAAEVVALITTEKYLRFRYEDDNVRDFSLSITEDTVDIFSYSLTREVDIAGKVPKVAKKLVGDSLTVIQQQSWRKDSVTYPGEMTVEAKGLPGKITAVTHVVSVDGDNCKLIVNGQVHVSIPLVGSQLEKVLVGRIEESFFQSGDTVRAFVTEHKKQA